MMSKTHLSVGMATALAVAPAVTNITSASDCMFVVAFGAIGGVLADVDILEDDYKHDALFGELIALGLLILATAYDFFTTRKVCDDVISHWIISAIGAVAFLVLWIIGYNGDHRDYTHSLLFMCFFSGAVALIYFPMTFVFAASYLSHLILDILNKKGIRLFFPAEISFCFKLCYANKVGNMIFMILGFIATAILLGMNLSAIN